MSLIPYIDLTTVKGFLADDEAQALYNYASIAAPMGPILEVGSYCGKSTLFLAAAAQQSAGVVFAVDHHRGSEEHQVGEAYHDETLFDESLQQFDTFNAFRANIQQAQLDDIVVPIVSPSVIAAKFWSTPLALVFIDGGHSFEAAENDYKSWAPLVKKGGYLLIHDLFPNPDEGGQAPITIYRKAIASGLFEAEQTVNTLGILRRI